MPRRPPTSESGPAWTTTHLNLRSGPGTSHPVIRVLEPVTRVAVTAGIAPGVRERAGQQLGLTVRSGNARSTPPHLHFGVSRPTAPEDWEVRRGHVAPAPYLDAWKAGRLATPDLAAGRSGVC